MVLQLNLQKSAKSLRLSLDKAGVRPDFKADLIFDLDVSGSFEHEHEEGTTSKLIARLVPYGMVLDPDGQMDVFTFSHGQGSVHHVGTVTPDNCEDYVIRNVFGMVPGWGGGTTYSHVLEANLRHFGWLPMEAGGWLSRFLFGASKPDHKEKKRSIIIFVTDGENEPADHARATRILEESQERGDQVYFLFVGACEHEGVDFEFLQEIAGRFRNTGLVIIRDLDSFVDLSDEQLNERLLGPELLEWLKRV
ncbi:VWA domain-containing protein [Pleomorphomonas sp. PLEO]|uniref:VWA domain-containing protein n=1 Tax=Pleomorphomonas sp. PLEO TaxID=3239306 RepID=UPI00351E119A